MTRAVRRRATVGLLLVVAAVLAAALRPGSGSDDPTAVRTPSTTTSATPTTTPRDPVIPTTTVAPGSTTAANVAPAPGTAAARVDTLVVAGPPSGLAPYRRDAFGGDWDYDPATGCNTRERVLIEESLVPPLVDAKCRSTGGRWRSAYDGRVLTDVADLQIDHFIPLADAWRSGAAAWTDDRRRAFANDLSSPETLVAVTGSTNASKSDSTPDQWLPPDRGSWCAYATAWVDVKATWQLTVTPAEKATLVQVLSGC